MQIYYPSIAAIQQRTLQLHHEQCSHCKQTQQLVSHGFIRKKRVGALPAAIGKRVFCSNRRRHTGCGRTVQLYLASTLRYLHFAAAALEAFLLALLAGMTIQCAYLKATRTAVPRNAYRWLNKLMAQLSAYRSLLHQPRLSNEPKVTLHRNPRRGLLMTSTETLFQQFGLPLCAGLQLKWQRAFL